MNREETPAVSIKETKTSEFEIIRTSLLPGLMKSIEANKSAQLPFKIFEVSDIVVLDSETETGSRNLRKLAFAYTGLTSGFEVNSF